MSECIIFPCTFLISRPLPLCHFLHSTEYTFIHDRLMGIVHNRPLRFREHTLFLPLIKRFIFAPLHHMAEVDFIGKHLLYHVHLPYNIRIAGAFRVPFQVMVPGRGRYPPVIKFPCDPPVAHALAAHMEDFPHYRRGFCIRLDPVRVIRTFFIAVCRP